MRGFLEDVKVFCASHPGGIAKFIYYPSFRVVLIFRLSQFFYRIKLRPLAYLLTNLNDFLHGVWIGPRVQAGKGLSLAHPRGMVLNPGTVIGDYCTLLNGVTLGGPSVTLGNYVEVCAGASVISTAVRPITIGDHAVIGAGAVVVSSVGARVVVGGVPAKAIKENDLGAWFAERSYLEKVWKKSGAA